MGGGNSPQKIPDYTLPHRNTGEKRLNIYLDNWNILWGRAGFHSSGNIPILMQDGRRNMRIHFKCLSRYTLDIFLTDISPSERQMAKQLVRNYIATFLQHASPDFILRLLLPPSMMVVEDYLIKR